MHSAKYRISSKLNQDSKCKMKNKKSPSHCGTRSVSAVSSGVTGEARYGKETTQDSALSPNGLPQKDKILAGLRF